MISYLKNLLRNGGEVMYNDLTKPRKHSQRSENEWNEHGFTVSTNLKYHTITQQKIEDLISRTIDPQAIPCLIPSLGKLMEVNDKLPLPGVTALSSSTTLAITLVLHPIYATSVL